MSVVVTNKNGEFESGRELGDPGCVPAGPASVSLGKIIVAPVYLVNW